MTLLLFSVGGRNFNCGYGITREVVTFVFYLWFWLVQPAGMFLLFLGHDKNLMSAETYGKRRLIIAILNAGIAWTVSLLFFYLWIELQSATTENCGETLHKINASDVIIDGKH
jgi:hypothetical protein